MAIPDVAEIDDALRRADAVDRRLDEATGARLSLDPHRERATTIRELVYMLAPRAERLPPGTLAALSEGLDDTTAAIVEHFPGNVFWDLDALAAALLDGSDGPDSLRDGFARVVALQQLFGRTSTIRFRYAHDFIYGFDWAKWVRREPTERRDVGPFDVRFLGVLHNRGLELLGLIEADDAKYPRLHGEGARNPFVFSREPDDERALHRALAVEGLIPVQAWLLDPTPGWDRPFADLRAARASAI